MAAPLLAAGLLGACNAAPLETGTTVAPATLTAPATPTPALHPAAARVPVLGDINGLSDRELAGLLGEPDFRRIEPPGELWQYRSAQCVLDVFLYAEKGGARVVHSETRARNLEASIGRCVERDEVLRARTPESRL